MAAKKKAAKPKGIVDDAAKGIVNYIQSVTTSTKPKITDPQSLAEFKAATKNILKTGATVGDAAFTGGLGSSLGKNVIAPGTKVTSPKTRSQAQNQGLAKFGIDVGVTAASAGAGAVVGKTIQAMLKAKQGTTFYGLHGSPVSGINKVKPGSGQNTSSFLQNMSSMNSTSNVPKKSVFSYEANAQNVVPAADYAQKFGDNVGKGSVYLVGTNNKNIVSHMVQGKSASASDNFLLTAMDAEKISKKPMQVVKEFPVSNYTQRTYDKFEGGWDTTQNFNPVAKEINAAIAADQAKKAKALQQAMTGSVGSAVAASAPAKQKSKPKARRNIR
jgi:hypothetical protein